VARMEAPAEGGVVTFGEVDFGGGDGGHASRGPIGVSTDDTRVSQPPSGGSGMRAAATAPVSAPLRQPTAPGEKPVLERPVLERPKRTYGKPVAGALVIVALLGGATLQVTSYGAFGYLVIGDLLRSGAYRRSPRTPRWWTRPPRPGSAATRPAPRT